MEPCGGSGVGCPPTSLAPLTYVPLVESWSITIMRSSAIVQWRLDTLEWPSTSEAREGSRPMIRRPGCAVSWPTDSRLAVIAG